MELVKSSKFRYNIHFFFPTNVMFINSKVLKLYDNIHEFVSLLHIVKKKKVNAGIFIKKTKHFIHAAFVTIILILYDKLKMLFKQPCQLSSSWIYIKVKKINPSKSITIICYN